LNASVFVVGPKDGATAALADLARGIGFTRVDRYQGLRHAEKQTHATPLLFFFCAAVPDVKTLKATADAIRFSPTLNLRFSPLIYFARDPAIATIKQCIKMGFDDVIALPYAGGDLTERVLRQVGQSLFYYETATYFGPDRRNRVGEARSTESDHGGGQFRRIEIRRNPLTGTDVLSDDFEVVI
jgi:hypothetical protein